MRVVIRTDASTSIGSGHVLRCLVLADALRFRGDEIIFVSRRLSGNLFNLINAKSYDLIALNPPDHQTDNNSHDTYIENLGVSSLQDAKETIEFIRKLAVKVDLLIVDHYSLDFVWESRLREYVEKILVIDDLAINNHDADYLLNQDYLPNHNVLYKGLIPEHCKLFLGLKYAILDPAYKQGPKRVSRSGNIRKILIFYGSSDLTNETDKALSVLKASDYQHIDVNAVIGFTNQHRDLLERNYSDTNHIRLIGSLSNLSAIMAESDLYVGAGGITVIEALSMGLPSLVTITAENQVPSIRHLHDNGYLTCLGSAADVNEQIFKTMVDDKLLSNPQTVRYQSDRGMQLVDADGINRLVAELTSL
jgi:UDP-2,4-diacetamido-2,4,6-trideoxy-beta-L-altropyranose hydrolase